MAHPNGTEFSTTTLRTGPRLHYAEQGDKEGEAIVFLHAYADSWFSYGRMLHLLSPAYHALAPDQRGHGDSDKPECCYAADDFAADVDAFMDAVGIEEATLVGDSSGGLIAQRVALDYPHHVSRLVLIGSPTTLVTNETVMEAREDMLALEDPISPEFVREFVESTIHHSVREEFLERVVSESLKVPARVWRDYYEGVLTIDDTARLGEIGAPTLVLWGEQDAVLPREEQERRAAVIPDATLRVYPDTGHLVHWERPAWVVRDLEAFIKDTPRPRPFSWTSHNSPTRTSEDPDCTHSDEQEQRYAQGRLLGPPDEPFDLRRALYSAASRVGEGSAGDVVERVRVRTCAPILAPVERRDPVHVALAELRG